MAPIRVALNGCGRIGRLALRFAWEHPETFELVHLNDITAIESVAYLIKYDSVHGTWRPEVKAVDKKVVITDGDRVLEVPYTNCADVNAVSVTTWRSCKWHSLSY